MKVAIIRVTDTVTYADAVKYSSWVAKQGVAPIICVNEEAYQEVMQTLRPHVTGPVPIDGTEAANV